MALRGAATHRLDLVATGEEGTTAAPVEVARRGVVVVHRLGDGGRGDGTAAAPLEVVRRGAATHRLALAGTGGKKTASRGGSAWGRAPGRGEAGGEGTAAAPL